MNLSAERKRGAIPHAKLRTQDPAPFKNHLCYQSTIGSILKTNNSLHFSQGARLRNHPTVGRTTLSIKTADFYYRSKYIKQYYKESISNLYANQAPIYDLQISLRGFVLS